MVVKMSKQAIYNLNREDLNKWAKSAGISTFYAEKVWLNLYRNKVSSFDKMTDIKKEHLVLLNEAFYFTKLEEVVVQKANDKTMKFLFKLYDESLIETVVMNHKFGKSICVTTQIGCNIGCNFCASGLKPKKRDLETSEIIAQIMQVNKYLLDTDDEALTHVVVMGIGEPFDNYKNLMKFLSIINDDKGLAIASRKITVSTSGLAPKIIAFAKEKIRANMALSLHAPNDELRSKLMKINKSYPLTTVFDAINKYIEITNKRVTFEYILIKDFNDQIKQAKELVNLIKPLGKNAYVNLIPYNPVFEVEFERSLDKDIDAFFEYLTQNNIRCVIRKEHGGEIEAACGQLRSEYSKTLRLPKGRSELPN